MPLTTIEMVVEIPTSRRNKYEFDPATGGIHLTRQLPAALVYPADYGFVIETLAEDGDALDALLLISEPTFPGCRVEVRPLAVLWMEDEHGSDPKLITALPSAADYEGWTDIGDLPRRTLDEIEHFFTVYKDLESGSSARTHGYEGRHAAEALVKDCQERYLRSLAGDA